MPFSEKRSTLRLAEGFPAYGEADWRAAAAKGRRDPDMSTRPIPLHPRREGARAIDARPAGTPWRIIERIDAADGPEAKRAAVDALAGGATGVALAFAGNGHPLTGSLPLSLAGEIAAALADAPHSLEVRIESDDPIVLAAFLEGGAGRFHIVRAFDPVAALAATGRIVDTGRDITTAARAFDAGNIAGNAVIADGSLWHAGGATEELELGATLATFVAHLRVLGAPDRIGVALAADADQFRTIAKFRAIRLLLARIMEIADLGNAVPQVHAETAWRMVSARDERMNVLRTTSATFGAAVGGADSITVLPFDVLSPVPDGHGRRLARNTQIILADEARLARVADPGAGSGTIEAMTAAFAAAAWKRFQAIEADGGIVVAIGEGSLLREIAEAREARLASIANGDTRMVGVNAFTGAPTNATYRRSPVGRSPTLVFKRLSEPFETTAP